MTTWGGIVMARSARGGDSSSSVPVECLAPAANRPLVTHAVEMLTAAGLDPIGLSYPHALARPVRVAANRPGAWPPAITQIETPNGMSEPAQVLAARARLGVDAVVVHAADALVDADLEELIELVEDEQIDAVAVVPNALSEPRREPVTAGLRLRDRPDLETPLLLLGEHALRMLAQLDERGEAVALERFAPALLGAGGRIHRVEARRVWQFRSGAEALLEANRMALDSIIPSLPSVTLEDTTVHGAVRIDPSARIRRSVIRGPLVVGADARIQDSYVGPYTAIGARAIVDGSEVEHSVLMAGAELRHIGGRLEGSVLGEGACVTRTFSLPRALHLHLGPRAEVTLAD